MTPKQPHLQTSDLKAALCLQKHWMQYEEDRAVDIAQLMLDQAMQSAIYVGPTEDGQHFWDVELNLRPAPRQPAEPHTVRLVVTTEGVLTAALPPEA